MTLRPTGLTFFLPFQKLRSPLLPAKSYSPLDGLSILLLGGGRLLTVADSQLTVADLQQKVSESHKESGQSDPHSDVIHQDNDNLLEPHAATGIRGLSRAQEEMVSESLLSGRKDQLNHQEEKAARADDASIPYHLWDDKVWGLHLHSRTSVGVFINKYNNRAFMQKHGVQQPCPLAIIQHFLFRRWCRNIYTDLVRWMKTHHGNC
jgi:hypothetical protein